MKKNTIITLLVLPLLTMMLIACSKHNAKDSAKKEEKKATMIAANQDKRAAFEKISIASRQVSKNLKLYMVNQISTTQNPQEM